MPKRVPEEAKRVALNCLVLPETLKYLRAVGGSQGHAVDRAVAALQTQERVMAETGDPWKAVSIPQSAAKYAEKLLPPSSNHQPQSWKRGPRPKGDKSR